MEIHSGTTIDNMHRCASSRAARFRGRIYPELSEFEQRADVVEMDLSSYNVKLLLTDGISVLIAEL